MTRGAVTMPSLRQKTHTPEDRRLFNKSSNKLKVALQEMRNTSFAAYVSSLNRDDNSIRTAIKSMKIPQTSLPPIRKNSIPPGPWAKSDKEKVELFATHLSEVFTPHDNIQDPEVEREITTHTQPSEREITTHTQPSESLQAFLHSTQTQT